jgi:hypothetical protein
MWRLFFCWHAVLCLWACSKNPRTQTPPDVSPPSSELPCTTGCTPYTPPPTPPDTTPPDTPVPPNPPPPSIPCPSGSVRHRDGVQCIACTPSCNQQEGSAGETDPRAMAGTECVCKTAQGYFLSPGENGRSTRIVPCDADNDQWIRNTLQGLNKYIGAPNNAVLFDNNTCHIPLIKSFHIRNEWGETVAVHLLNQPTPMIEPLETDTDPNAHALTKECSSSISDLNRNGMPDIEERHEETDQNYIDFLRTHGVAADVLNDFTYFRELYTGFFEEEQNTYQGPTGGTLIEGHFVIQERMRMPTTSSSIRLNMHTHPQDNEYPPNIDGYGGNNYWRQCVRFQDSAYLSLFLNKQPLYNMDFMRHAVHASVVFQKGMLQLPYPTTGHASQFKCIAIKNNTTHTEPYEFSSTQAQRWVLNNCPLNDLNAPCSVTTPQEGFVGFAIMPYTHQTTGPYTQGCINEYLYFKARCPGYSTHPESVQGDGDQSNFGKLLCGCSLAYGGPSCTLGCPYSEEGSGLLFTHPAYRESSNLYPISKRHYWMCASISTAHTEALFFKNTLYSLHGQWTPFYSSSPYITSSSWKLSQGFLPSHFYSQRAAP